MKKETLLIIGIIIIIMFFVGVGIYTEMLIATNNYNLTAVGGLNKI